VGESGSGKTTLGRTILRLLDGQGAIRFEGQALEGLDTHAMRPLRRRLQIVFQDPFGALSPRMRVADIVGEGLRIHDIGNRGPEREQLVVEALREVGLDPESRFRY